MNDKVPPACLKAEQVRLDGATLQVGMVKAMALGAVLIPAKMPAELTAENAETAEGEGERSSALSALSAVDLS